VTDPEPRAPEPRAQGVGEGRVLPDHSLAMDILPPGATCAPRTEEVIDGAAVGGVLFLLSVGYYLRRRR